ncbi:MAG: hypothetical protein ACYTGC_02140, partial [Planctomycetota bacterium]
ERRKRLRTVEEVMADPDQYRKLPGYDCGVTPWWPHMRAPPDVNADDPSGAYCLHEVEPDHWVGCWRGEYLRRHPQRPADVAGIAADAKV